MKIVAYHGSQTSKLKIRKDSVLYFVTNYEKAKSYAKREWDEGLIEGEIPVIYTAELTINKPYMIKDYDEFQMDFTSTAMGEYGREKLIRRGYDSAIYNDRGDKLIAVFYPSQIEFKNIEKLPKSKDYYYNGELDDEDDINDYYYEDDKLYESLNDNFRQWFGNSKVVDKNGEPLTVYHGTKDIFDEFNYNEGRKYDNGYLGRGFYFTDNLDSAIQYSNWKQGYNEPTVKKVYLRIINPLYVKNTNQGHIYSICEMLGLDEYKNEERMTSELAKIIQEATINNGHDGIISHSDFYNETTYVVFNSNQVKSIDNNGDWSNEKKNINESTSTNNLILKPSDSYFDINGKNFESEDYDLYKIYDDDEFIGNIALRDTKKFLEIAGLKILPNYRMQGYGTKIVNCIRDKFSKPIYVRAIPTAKEFWDKFGFKSKWNDDSGTYDGNLKSESEQINEVLKFAGIK